MISPVLRSLAAYPFTRLNEAIADAEARGIDVIDFGMGDPREPTPEFVRRALVESVPERSGYPLASGLPEHRAAIAAWAARRFAVELDPATEIVPTLGSK
nr:succinyldiaminopimelate transaminase [Actinomycetota bacterium]